MPDYLEVPDEIVRCVRAACAHLPEAYEDRPWTGARWRIRGRTIVHVVTVMRDGRPVTHMTFFASGDERDALLAIGHPYHPGWGEGLLAMVLSEDGSTDWEEVRELLTESYCLLAPKKLIALLGSYRPES